MTWNAWGSTPRIYGRPPRWLPAAERRWTRYRSRLLDADAPEPLITGVLDFDRAEFGDPAADWTIRMAQAKPDEREAFWESYGDLDRTPTALWRAAIYEARHLAAIRLERHRLAKPEAIRESYQTMAKTLAELS